MNIDKTKVMVAGYKMEENMLVGREPCRECGTWDQLSCELCVTNGVIRGVQC